MRALLFRTPPPQTTTTHHHAIHPTEEQQHRQRGTVPPSPLPPSPPTSTAVDWKLIMERAHELEQQEKALLADIERKAERRRQKYEQVRQRRRISRNSNSSSKTCYDCFVGAAIIQEPAEEPPYPRGSVRSSSSPKNKKIVVCDEMHMGLLPNKYNKSRTSDESGSGQTLTEWSWSVEDSSAPRAGGGLAFHKGIITASSATRGHTWAQFSGTSPPTTDLTVVVAHEPKYSTLSEF